MCRGYSFRVVFPERHVWIFSSTRKTSFKLSTNSFSACQPQVFFFRLGPTDLQVKGEMTQYDPYIEGPRNHPFLVLGSNFNPQDTPRSTVQPRVSWVQGLTRPSVQRSVKRSCVKWRPGVHRSPGVAIARMRNGKFRSNKNWSKNTVNC